MNCHDLDTLLADYLASELDAAALAQVESHLDSCPECRTRAHALAAAQRAAATLIPPRHLAEQATRTTSASPLPDVPNPPARTRAAWPILRMAAAVLIAFSLGYIARSTTARPVAATSPVAAHTPAGPAPTSLADVYAQTARRFPQGSPFAWGLMAIARQ